MPFSFRRLSELPVQLRLAYVEEHLAEIEKMPEEQLTQIGTLLCHSSSAKIKQERPIEGDRLMNPQEIFEKLAPSVGIERAAQQAAYEEKVWS